MPKPFHHDPTAHNKPFTTKGKKPESVRTSVGGVYAPGKAKVGHIVTSVEQTMKTSSMSAAAIGAVVGLLAGQIAQRLPGVAQQLPGAGPLRDAALGALGALFATRQVDAADEAGDVPEKNIAFRQPDPTPMFM
jgi:uncharacterized membrane protein YeaQ/YmgE (transglycosylase-associated protein family)